MRVLVLNAGSSSLKYRLLGDADRVLLDGTIGRIGEEGSDVADHRAAIERVVEELEAAGLGDAVDAIGHRVVHGGEVVTTTTRIDEQVIAEIRAQVPLAPLHNPANLLGIEAATDQWPDLPQAVVLDTAFHATLPPSAHRYALPAWAYEEHGVRRYGFHGTSHAYVARAAAEFLGRPLEELDLITLHLGNGASATAIRGGISVDTSMGMSPLEGLVMGTRSGDVDAAVPFHLMREAGLTAAEVERLLNRESGLKGLSGGDNDMRKVVEAAEAGEADARLAIDVYVHRIRRYVGAYTAVLGNVDALVFTAGVGENSPQIRQRVCADLGVLGIELDPERNAEVSGPTAVESVETTGSRVAVLVVPTDEEAEIAAQTRACLGERSSRPAPERHCT